MKKYFLFFFALFAYNAASAQKGEIIAIRELKGLIPHFFSGFPGYKKIRMEIVMNVQNSEQLFALLEGVRSRMSL